MDVSLMPLFFCEFYMNWYQEIIFKIKAYLKDRQMKRLARSLIDVSYFEKDLKANARTILSFHASINKLDKNTYREMEIEYGSLLPYLPLSFRAERAEVLYKQYLKRLQENERYNSTLFENARRTNQGDRYSKMSVGSPASGTKTNGNGRIYDETNMQMGLHHQHVMNTITEERSHPTSRDSDCSPSYSSQSDSGSTSTSDGGSCSSGGGSD